MVCLYFRGVSSLLVLDQLASVQPVVIAPRVRTVEVDTYAGSEKQVKQGGMAATMAIPIGMWPFGSQVGAGRVQAEITHRKI